MEFFQADRVAGVVPQCEFGRCLALGGGLQDSSDSGFVGGCC